MEIHIKVAPHRLVQRYLQSLASCLVLALLTLTTSLASTVSLDTYGTLPAFEQAALSPSGERIALIGLLNNVRHVLIIGADNKLQRTFTLGDMKLVGLTWAGDNALLVQYRNTAALGIGFTADKTELAAMMVLPMDGGKPWEVFNKEKSITGGIRGFYGVVERLGHWYGYFGGITLERNSATNVVRYYLSTTNPDLYEVDLASGDTKRIAKRAEADNSRRDWVVGVDGAAVTTLDFSTAKGDWRILNAARDIILTGQSPTGGIELLSLGRTANTILYFHQDDATGEGRFYEIAQTGGTPVEVLADIGIRRRFTHQLGREFIGYETDEDFPQTQFFDTRQNKIVAAIRKAFPNKHATLIDWNRDFSRQIVQTDGPGDSGTWWLVDIKTGAANILGASYPMPATQVGPVRMVTYQASDGLAMSGVLTLPPNREAKNLPVIVLPHGGPAARDYPEFNWWAQAFAVQGYAVLQPNFRGSTGYGADFRQAGRGQWGHKMQTDISDGLAELVRQGIADPKRACIMGASYGGYAALAGVTLQQHLYRCAVSVAGIGDINEMYRSDIEESGYNQTLIRNLRENLGEYRDFKDISPINFVDRVDAPILLIHGKDDTVVNYKQSKDMEKALRKAGKPVQLVTLEEEDHWLSKSTTRLKMLKSATEFILKYNPPD